MIIALLFNLTAESLVFNVTTYNIFNLVKRLVDSSTQFYRLWFQSELIRLTINQILSLGFYFSSAVVNGKN